MDLEECHFHSLMRESGGLKRGEGGGGVEENETERETGQGRKQKGLISPHMARRGAQWHILQGQNRQGGSRSAFTLQWLNAVSCECMRVCL